jgi:hypothetical protein
VTPQEFENQVKAFLNGMASVPTERIRPVVRQMFDMLGQDAPLYEDKEDFIERIARSLESKLNLSMPDATVIKLSFAEWLTTRRTSTELFYWDRYRRHLLQSGFAKEVAGTIGRDTDKIVGLLEDPLKSGEWKRRGLVVGHVQSGKTANYSGVICKAADYGYKVIILLAGVHNNLRSQTQQRLEEAFIGVDTDRLDRQLPFNEVKTGVGRISDINRIPFSLTSREYDFRKSSKKASTFSLGSVKEPVVFVIKKQTSVLNNLIEWLKGLNETKGGKILGTPMLLIDDEADNASINTASAENDPTRINSLIRQLLALFEQTSYVGYTATPFANIFIDPDTEHEMLEDDLFPRHFIITLDAPENYVSAARIFGDDGDLGHVIVPVEDHLHAFPERHKITHQVNELPLSLMEAVRRFVLGRAARILRERGQDHSSMLVNVSRFNGVQRQVTALLGHYLEELLNSAKLHSGLPDAEALRDPGMRDLHDTFALMNVPGGERWPQVKAKLPLATGSIVVKTINNKSPDRLDYSNHRETGLHVIAVGGLSLSRGFTLEGLSVSYFIRNSIMYDTLLQMGRWFGYRDGYLDLCSLYMTDEAISWYSHISSAIDELRVEFRLMEQLNRSPEDFGLKVRTHPDSLIVTARNKMRTGKKMIHSVSLDGRLVETVRIRSSKASLENNFGEVARLVSELDASRPRAELKGLGRLWGDVGSETICGFLSKFDAYGGETSIAQPNPIIEFIRKDSARLGKWDVCLYGIKDGKKAAVGPVEIGQQRRGCFDRGDCYVVSGTKSRVASRGAERAGLSPGQIEEARKAVGGADNIPDIAYRTVRSRPLLMLHVLDLGHETADSETRLADKACAWGISFPGVKGSGRGVLVEYLVNTVWWKEQFDSDLEEDSDE